VYERDDLTRSGRIETRPIKRAQNAHSRRVFPKEQRETLRQPQTYIFAGKLYMGQRNFGVRLDLSTPSGPWTNFMSLGRPRISLFGTGILRAMLCVGGAFF
jgi:hypothetical protein